MKSSKKHSGLLIGALGVVYGDIGTSPLYAIRESLHSSHGIPLLEENVLGILSLIFWSLTLVIFVKYLVFILRADNRGDGGITALLAIILRKMPANSAGMKVFITFLGLLGAGLLYGDGVLTPSISVLSAVEGLKIAAPQLGDYVVPITVAILVGLFLVQRAGTARVGLIFGPITLLWFITLAAIGLPWVFKAPQVFMAVNPVYAIQFFIHNGMPGFLVLSSVVLAITGGEALYADMGHFGKRPIRMGWALIVFPALILNYFGQGALVLSQGHEVLENTFYGMVSGWVLYPLIGIATLATVIASQALISGVFSLTQQNVQLGFLPRTKILHTSRETEGQIFVPGVNNLLMFACIGLVVMMKDSSRLAAAYGIAVTGTMVITSVLFYFVLRWVWNWKRLPSLLLVGSFLVIDGAFLISNLTKILQGGWLPILIAVGVVTVMSTWRKGRECLAWVLQKDSVSIQKFLDRIKSEKPVRVSGTAVFMSLTQDITPSVLLHHYRHNRVLHERLILLSIVFDHLPDVPATDRVRVTELSQGFFRVVAHFGYMESPDVSSILRACQGAGLVLDSKQVSYYLGRETFVLTGSSPMANWRKRLFVRLSKNARTASEFFKLPPDQVVEMGSQVVL